MKKKFYVLVCIIAFSIIWFICVYGFNILVPTNTDLFLMGEDRMQHYVGWKAFRTSSWGFPFGLTDSLAYPVKTSVIFTDSIPCFALFFKLLSPILPNEFQYLGIWALLCFVLIAVCAFFILSKYTDNALILFFGSIFFLLIPSVYIKVLGHSALGAQWIILFTLYPLLIPERLSDKKMFFRALAIGAIAASVHIYFLLFCGIILFFSSLYYFTLDRIEGKKTIIALRNAILQLAIFVASALVVIALLGGFSSGLGASSGQPGKYSANLNALFNPQQWSYFFSGLPLYGNGQYEGFAYLGLGGFILLGLGIVFGIMIIAKEKMTKARVCRISALLLTILAATFVAVFPVVSLGDRALFELPLPGIIRKIWGIFRSHGRAMWIVAYILYFVSLWSIIKWGKSKRTASNNIEKTVKIQERQV